MSVLAGTWTPSVAEGRWCGFGPYYAMFPVDFVRKTIATMCPPGGGILDPFCGRGTTLFVGQVTGHASLGADLNPVAWIYSAVKLDPFDGQTKILGRLTGLLEDVGPEDCEPENEFQRLAWHRQVLGFLKSARRNLDWRRSSLDRTLMAIVLVYLHAKRGAGLSNQLRQSKAMAPDYSVRWWREKDMKPPRVDIRSFFTSRLAWRYKEGLPAKKAVAKVLFGDARRALPGVRHFEAQMILTSPPYYDVTNYEYDNWIRLWMLGGPSLPDHKAKARFGNQLDYERMLTGVFKASRRLSVDDVTVYVRTDARQFTLATTIDTLHDVWPRHNLFFRTDKATGPTQTALYGNEWHKAGEVDLVAKAKGKRHPEGFHLLLSA